MEQQPLSRVYLETLSSADLVSLADEYGIDIPEGLSRRFIIGELLDAALDNGSAGDALREKDENTSDPQGFTFPKTYNETQITVLLRNPAWAFVYWDVKESDLRDMQMSRAFSSFVLRVSFFVKPETEKAHEVYDIPVRYDDREQYVLLAQSEAAVRIDLVAEFKTCEPRILARSRKINIPRGSVQVSGVQLNDAVSPILALSGLPQLRRSHYNIHRQSFS